MIGKKVIEKDIVVIGAGVSGLMFASLHHSLDFALVDKNYKVGKKLKVSGGGKCNITNQNISYKNYLGDETFVKEILKQFSPKELLRYFDGIEFVKRKNHQYFCKNSADEIVEFFLSKIDKKKIFLGCEVLDVSYHDKRFFIECSDKTFEAKYLIVASGGLSFKELGATDIAYKIAKKFGHTVTTLKPALVGLTLQKDDFWMKKLSGVSLKVKIKIADKEFVDDMLFAHRGISGPVILNSSLYWEKGSIMIDFLPDGDLKLGYKQKQISSNLPLPKRFIKEFLSSQGLEDKVVSKLKKDELEKLSRLKSYALSPAGDFGYKKAEVTKGGIKCNDIDVKSMESKLQDRLYFIGECIDMTGELGGFNIHQALSMARALKLKKYL